MSPNSESLFKDAEGSSVLMPFSLNSHPQSLCHFADYLNVIIIILRLAQHTPVQLLFILKSCFPLHTRQWYYTLATQKQR